MRGKSDKTQAGSVKFNILLGSGGQRLDWKVLKYQWNILTPVEMLNE